MSTTFARGGRLGGRRIDGCNVKDTIDVETVAKREREEVEGLALAIVSFARESDTKTKAGLARLRAAHIALEAIGVDLATPHTSTRSPSDAEALLRRRSATARGAA